MMTVAEPEAPMAAQRQRSVKHRGIRLYATPARALPTPASAPSTPVVLDEFEEAFFVEDEPPQIPPLPISPISPISPRWDSLANGNNLIYQNAHPSKELLPADAARPDSRDISPASNPHSPIGEASSSHEIPAVGPKPHTVETRPSTENFSRPRKPSIKQPVQESAYSRPLPSAPVDGLADPTPQSLAKARARGQSVSSARSASTFASLPPAPFEAPQPKVLRSRNPAPVPSRPPLNYNKPESVSSGSFAPWMSNDELRSSYRSQLTASTAQGTYTTERSSVLTKGSSVTSIYASIDEPSLEDVMGLYEKGFNDDTDREDNFDGPSRPLTSRSELSLRHSKVLEAMADPLPVPSLSIPIPESNQIIRDSAAIFRHSGLPSSLPGDVGLAAYSSSTAEKRDSAKSLTTQKQASRTSSLLAGAVLSISQEEKGTRDRYGFRKHNQHVSREQFDAWDAEYSEYLARRRTKWVAYLKDSGLMTDRPRRFPPASAKTKRFIRKGIPPDWRGAAWFYYAGGPAILAKHPGLYDELTRRRAKESDVEIIERDLYRTFPDNVRFKPPGADDTAMGGQQTQDTDKSQEPEIISSLRRVLHAFSIYNPRIGYCQSLNFLAGLLLLFVETEEQCFWLLNVMTRVYLPGTHETSLEGAMVDLGVLMASLKEAMPGIWTKISGELEDEDVAGSASRPTTSGRTAASAAAAGTTKKSGIGSKSASRKKDLAVASDRLPPITLCMQAWFMSCFVGTLPMEATLRVWDVLFYEGSKTLFRMALAILKKGEAEIRAVADPMEMFSVVQGLPKRMLDANALMEACFKRRNGFGHISQETVEGRRDTVQRARRAGVARAAAGRDDEHDPGHVTEGEAAGSEVRRKGTIFGRRRKKGGHAEAGRASEVM